MSITYEEALQTLTSMFGEPWTEDILDEVLRHHEGHMENTVESVLSHGNGDPQALLDKLNFSGTSSDEQSSAEQVQMQMAADEELARQIMQDEASSIPPGLRNAAAASSSTKKTSKQTKSGLGTPTQLPPDFLRVPGIGQLDQDEALARMMQDSMFAKEVKKNPEFANNSGLFNRTSATAGGNPAGPGIMNALSEMGENAKTRLSLLARRFNQNRNNRAAANNTSTGGVGGSSGAGERRGLLDNDLGEEEVSFSGSKPDFELSEWTNNKPHRL